MVSQNILFFCLRDSQHRNCKCYIVDRPISFDVQTLVLLLNCLLVCVGLAKCV